MSSSAITSTSTCEREWLALSLTPQVGPTRCKRLISYFGNVENIFRASLTELEAAGLPAVAAQSIALGQSLKLAEEELEKAAKASAAVITPSSPEYPTRLKHIYADGSLRPRKRGCSEFRRNCRHRYSAPNPLWNGNGRATLLRSVAKGVRHH